ncbi:DegT/DnrJ/EryC1/StrS family aminotransferase [Leifsonia sp. EB34]|uniref:DegT/DnrJ/EryC1/StrS family aminotransferase n=1 Tax=Leifsonia sp. EB34 TaxID=3156303 RepID=UPI003516FF44
MATERASSPQSPDLDLVLHAHRALDDWLEARVQTPSSQLTGGGAIGLVEARLSAQHEGRPVLLVPSASYGLMVVLASLGLRHGDEVLIPQYDWPASLAAVRTLGAVPVVVPVAPGTLTIDPVAAASRRTARTRAVVATHLFGIAADVAALRSTLPQLPVVEDCAQALGSTLDGRPVGALGDAAVLSFGPGKRLDAGELGAIVLRDHALKEAALRRSAHPLRQLHDGIAMPELGELSIRPHPIAAILLNAALNADEPGAIIAAHRALSAQLAAAGIQALGADERRGVAFPSAVLSASEPGAASVRMSLAGVSVTRERVLDIQAVANGRADARTVLFVAPNHTEPCSGTRSRQAGQAARLPAAPAQRQRGAHPDKS